MITPRFSLTQDEASVQLVVRCPYVRARDVEIYIAVQEFRFHVKPYFLRLTFPQAIVDSDDAVATYDATLGEFHITIPKELPGTFFENLDLLSSLLAPLPAKQLDGLIAETDLIDQESDSDNSGQEWNWQQDQLVDTDQTDSYSTPLLAHRYGFNMAYSNVFAPYGSELTEILDVGNPDEFSAIVRHIQRVESEDNLFSEDYFMIDHVSNRTHIKALATAETWWIKLYPHINQDVATLQKTLQQISLNEQPISIHTTSTEPSTYSKSNIVPTEEVSHNLSSKSSQQSTVASQGNDPITSTFTPDFAHNSLLVFTDEENDMMVRLKGRKVKVPKNLTVQHALLLFDIILAYVYDYRSTGGDHNVESSWTIAKLCSAFSCVEVHSSIDSVLQTFIRRSLTFPLYRSRALISQCIRDALFLFASLFGYILFDNVSIDKKPVIRVLLAVKKIMNATEMHWIFNRIWTEDAINWILYGITVKQCLRISQLLEEWGKTGAILSGDYTILDFYYNACDWRLNEWEALAEEMGEEEAQGDSDDEDEDCQH